jgi:hypothetical protein
MSAVYASILENLFAVMTALQLFMLIALAMKGNSLEANGNATSAK